MREGDRTGSVPHASRITHHASPGNRRADRERAGMASAQERHESWDPGVIYVVGHQRPDTDAIASSLGYAWFLHASGGAPVVPARAGHRAPQTEFALQRFEVEPPRLLPAVSPTFAHAAQAQTPV